MKKILKKKEKLNSELIKSKNDIKKNVPKICMDLSNHLYEKILGEKTESDPKEFEKVMKGFMITNLNVLDNATLWVAISFVIFVFLVFKPLKNMMLTSLDKKIAELKHQLEESKKLKEDADKLFTEQKKNMKKR